MISVVIPVYNAEDTIVPCVKSIYDTNQCEIEVVAVNDGSKDQSLKKLQELAAVYSTLKVIDQENRGNSLTRDTAIQNTTGEYIMFVDADDTLKEHAIDVIQKRLNTCNVDILYFGFETIFVEEGYSYETRVENQVFDTSYDAVDLMLRNGGFNLLWNKVYKASYLRGHHDFPVMKTTGQDFIFNCNVFQRVKRVMSMDEVLYCYMKRAKETMVTRYIQDGYGNLLRKQEALKKNLEAFGQVDTQGYKDYMIREYEVYLINMFAKDCKLSKKEKIQEVKSNILNQEAFAIINDAHALGSYTTLFQKVVRSKNAWYIVTVYSSLSWFKDTCGPIYQKIRKRYNH